MTELRFVCRTGIPIIARFDESILEVEVDDGAAFADGSDLDDDDWDREEALDETYALIHASGLERTHCSTEAAARRELRLLGVEI